MARALRFIQQRLVFPSAPPMQVLCYRAEYGSRSVEGWAYPCTGAPSPVFVLTSAYPRVGAQKQKAAYCCNLVVALFLGRVDCMSKRLISLLSTTTTVWIIHISNRRATDHIYFYLGFTICFYTVAG